ncbi:HAD-IA family hydrolase [Lacrimispora algidixylanolytica]|uniref:Hydrolase n=1 Tax=Lacrimispora algidixylanolytica TaxID=94868 RepID=A0A419TC15_9FIRM|nr:HAD-IA family hydrolase [Lacrimispora algidixylanolytica]RKD34977.1 hypothetical protein BET01_01065 [Lacrimispora algidixylanolytica]
MITVILFDFDGVLTIDKTGSESITKYISSNSNVPLDVVEACYYRYNQDLLCGKITHRDMWKSFCDEIGHALDYNILIDSFKNTKLDRDMITLVKELKHRYTIGMVTDNKVDRIETILEFNNLNKYFDVVSISARLHSGKEANYIFNDTLKKLNVLPEQCVFIDNTENNLVIPKQMGFRTLLFDDENRNFKIFKNQLQDMLK